MLYVLEGDQTKALEKLETLIGALLKKSPDAHVVRLDEDSFESESLSELVAAQGLFSPQMIIVLRQVLGRAEAKTSIVDARDELAGSKNVFFLIEEKVDAPTKKKFERVAEKWVSLASAQKKVSAVEHYNRFAFTDALAEGNRQKLWVEFQKAKLDNIPDEVLVDALAWQLKTLLLAAHADSPEAAGLKVLPYKKAKNALRALPAQRAALASEALLGLYHDARRGKHELSEALEHFLLCDVIKIGQ